MTTHARPTRPRGDHLAVVLSSLGLAFIGAAILLLIATAWYPPAPLTRLSISVVGTPRATGDLLVLVDYCKRSDVPPAEVRWALVDGVTVMLPPCTVTLPLGCHQTTVSLPLSRVVPPGVYQLQVTGIYRMWPWRDVVYTRRTPSFRLQPPDGALP